MAKADDNVGKAAMYKSIADEGFHKTSDLITDVTNKTTLNTVDVYFTGGGIRTDLIDIDEHIRIAQNQNEVVKKTNRK